MHFLRWPSTGKVTLTRRCGISSTAMLPQTIRSSRSGSSVSSTPLLPRCIQHSHPVLHPRLFRTPNDSNRNIAATRRLLQTVWRSLRLSNRCRMQLRLPSRPNTLASTGPGSSTPTLPPGSGARTGVDSSPSGTRRSRHSRARSVRRHRTCRRNRRPVRRGELGGELRRGGRAIRGGGAC
jgi:hypothetical protein